MSNTMNDEDILLLLLSGHKLRYEGNSNSCRLVHDAGEVSAETVSRLMKLGYIDSFANAGGYRLSDKGRKTFQYILNNSECEECGLQRPMHYDNCTQRLIPSH